MTISKIPGSMAPLSSALLQRSEAGTAKPTADAKPTLGSNVKLSMSETLKALAQEQAGQFDFDEKRVNALKQSIADGSFKVDAQKVATALIDEAKHLIQTTQK